MALVVLLNKWIKKNNGSLIALIIDHQIRKKSEIEAVTVKQYLFEHKIKSRILKINNKNVVKKTMKEARENRFNHLIKFCLLNHIFHLFLGHHSDDNIETFLLRKIAGSNFEGLFGIKYKVNIKGLQVLRPLLGFNKKEILKYNKDNCIYFVKDPSNNNLKYSRIIVRDFLSKKIKYKKQIEKDFHELKTYFPFYKKMIFQIFNKLTIRISRNNILIDNIIFFQHNEEIQAKIIEIIYKFLKPKKEFLRYKKILNSLLVLKSKKLIKTNLAGINIKRDVFFTSFAV